LYLRLIIFSVGDDVPVDSSETLLVTDFMNLKIKSTQSFGGAHRDRMCMCVLIDVSVYICISICLCWFLKLPDLEPKNDENYTHNHRCAAYVHCRRASHEHEKTGWGLALGVDREDRVAE
jgi:hypothetical protein